MIRIDTAGPAAAGTPAEARAQQARTGTWQGESLAVMSDQVSALGAAAEEITMAASEKADAKRLEEREVQPEQGADEMSMEEIREYLHHMHQEHLQEHLEQHAEHILAHVYEETHGREHRRETRERGERGPARREGASPREAVEGTFADPADQYVALQYVARRGEERGTGGQRMQDVYEALAELEEDFGPQIRAGLAAARGAGASAADAAGAQRLRDTYRDVVLGAGGLPQTFEAVMQRHGEDFPRAVPGLIKALGEDLSALRPSRDPERLQAVLQDLYNLEVVVTLLDRSRELAATIERRFGALPA